MSAITADSAGINRAESVAQRADAYRLARKLAAEDTTREYSAEDVMEIAQFLTDDFRHIRDWEGGADDQG